MLNYKLFTPLEVKDFLTGADKLQWPKFQYSKHNCSGCQVHGLEVQGVVAELARH